LPALPFLLRHRPVVVGVAVAAVVAAGEAVAAEEERELELRQAALQHREAEDVEELPADKALERAPLREVRAARLLRAAAAAVVLVVVAEADKVVVVAAPGRRRYLHRRRYPWWIFAWAAD
jgi:hypothetical protein